MTARLSYPWYPGQVSSPYALPHLTLLVNKKGKGKPIGCPESHVSTPLLQTEQPGLLRIKCFPMMAFGGTLRRIRTFYEKGPVFSFCNKEYLSSKCDHTAIFIISKDVFFLKKNTRIPINACWMNKRIKPHNPFNRLGHCIITHTVTKWILICN